MGANLTTEYQVVLTQSGNGASLAIADLKKLQAEALAVNGSLATGGKVAVEAANHYHTLKEGATASREALHALHGTMTLIGLESAPGMTIGIMAAVNGLKAMREAAILTGAGFLPISLALAGVAAGVATAVTGWRAYAAAEEEVKTGIDAANVSANLRYALVKKIRDLENEGKLAGETANIMAGSLMRAPTEDIPQLARGITEMLAERGLMVTAEQEKAVEKLKQLEHERVIEALDGYERERAAAYDKYAAEVKQLDALKLKATQTGGPEIAQGAYNAARESLMATQRRLDAQEAQKQQAADEAAANAARIATERETAEELKTFEQGLTIAALQSSETKIQIANREHDERIALYDDMFRQFKMDEVEYTNLVNDATIKQLQALKKTPTEMQTLGKDAMKWFSSGLASTLVDVNAWSKDAGGAFSKFFATLMQQIAQAILEFEIMQLVMGIAKGAAGGAGAHAPTWGAGSSAYAGGGVRFAADGLAGVSAVSAPTYFPRFNVLAGEAGPEMLTVLARPRFMSVGGMQAVVGQAGGNQLAITNAADLARGGAGGNVTIQVDMHPDLRASIVDQSVNGAVVRVTQDMGRHTALRAATRKA